MSIEVKNIRIFPINKPNISLKANGDFECGGLRVSFTVIQGAKGNFVGLPQEKYEKDGETKYKKNVQVVDETDYKTLQQEILAAYNKKMNGEESQVSPKTSSTPKKNNLPF